MKLRFLKTFLVLGILCSIISFFVILSTITLKNSIAIFAIKKQSRSFTAGHSRKVPPRSSYTRRERLLEHAVKLNWSQLLTCGTKTKPIVLSQTDLTNHTQVHRLLVPKWQSQPYKSRDSRHFLSAVVRLRLYEEDRARWTISELKQWIHYQLWAGVEHIYICNHYLKPEEIIAEDLEKYTKAGLVTVIDWSHIKAVPGSVNYRVQNSANQLGCYNHVKDKWGHLSTWMYTFDMDENPYCPQDHCEGFLSRFLENLNNGPDHNVALFFVENYVLKGQGDRSRDIHYDRINRITPTMLNGNVKVIFKTNWTAEAKMHDAHLRKGRKVKADPSVLKMLHYWGGRSQKWGPDTKEMLDSTVQFNDVRDTIAVAVRHSLLAFGDFDAFSNTTGP